jgi:glutathione S-transferase
LPIAIVEGKAVRPEFDALKAAGAFPLGQVPILEVNGTKLFQSKAIQRYIAGKTGLLGATPEEAALIDAVCESVFDMKSIISDAKDDAAKEAVAGKLADSFKALEGQLGEDGFAVGGKLSLADILLFYFATCGNASNLFNPAGCPAAIAAAKASPKVAKIIASVAANENVAKWEAGREGRNERF